MSYIYLYSRTVLSLFLWIPIAFQCFQSANSTPGGCFCFMYIKSSPSESEVEFLFRHISSVIYPAQNQAGLKQNANLEVFICLYQSDLPIPQSYYYQLESRRCVQMLWNFPLCWPCAAVCLSVHQPDLEKMSKKAEQGKLLTAHFIAPSLSSRGSSYK